MQLIFFKFSNMDNKGHYSFCCNLGFKENMCTCLYEVRCWENACPVHVPRWDNLVESVLSSPPKVGSGEQTGSGEAWVVSVCELSHFAVRNLRVLKKYFKGIQQVKHLNV